jgi:hypothetical protein
MYISVPGCCKAHSVSKYNQYWGTVRAALLEDIFQYRVTVRTVLLEYISVQGYYISGPIYGMAQPGLYVYQYGVFARPIY